MRRGNSLKIDVDLQLEMIKKSNDLRTLKWIWNTNKRKVERGPWSDENYYCLNDDDGDLHHHLAIAISNNNSEKHKQAKIWVECVIIFI